MNTIISDAAERENKNNRKKAELQKTLVRLDEEGRKTIHRVKLENRDDW